MKTPEQEAFLARLNPKGIEGVWMDHVSHCDRCQMYDEDRPATLSHVCPEGVQYLRVILRKKYPQKRQRAFRPGMPASKEELKMVTRYK